MSTPGNNSRSSSGNGAGGEKKTRDVIKKEKLSENVIGKAINTTEIVLKMILRNPKFWQPDQLGTVRQSIIDISRDPQKQKFPVPASGWGVERDDLTKDVASKLLNRTMSTPLEDDIFTRKI